MNTSKVKKSKSQKLLIHLIKILVYYNESYSSLKLRFLKFRPCVHPRVEASKSRGGKRLDTVIANNGHAIKY